ncbi:MAG: hemolysin III family protein [Balneolaceae bacterium]
MYKGEKFNSISHLIGSVASGLGLIVLLFIAIRQGDPWKVVSFGIYGTTLLTLYTFSTLYHSFRGKWKRIFQKLDHASIYLLIAGTYTPFTLVTLRGDLGWTMFAIIWGLATIGIVVDLMHRKGKRILPLIIYLLMGWLIVVIVDPLIEGISQQGFTWIATGGMFYTLGLIFYGLDYKYKLAHGIWHLFVLAGSLSHYWAVVYYI